MGVRLLAVKCPECGAKLDIEEGRKQLFCSFCGAKVLATNDNEYIYRKVDEARIKEAEIRETIRLKELEMEDSKLKQHESLRKMLTYLWVASIIIIGAICIYEWASTDVMSALFVLLYAGGPIVGGGAYLLFKVIPEKLK